MSQTVAEVMEINSRLFNVSGYIRGTSEDVDSIRSTVNGIYTVLRKMSGFGGSESNELTIIEEKVDMIKDDVSDISTILTDAFDESEGIIVHISEGVDKISGTNTVILRTLEDISDVQGDMYDIIDESKLALQEIEASLYPFYQVEVGQANMLTNINRYVMHIAENLNNNDEVLEDIYFENSVFHTNLLMAIAPVDAGYESYPNVSEWLNDFDKENFSDSAQQAPYIYNAVYPVIGQSFWHLPSHTMRSVGDSYLSTWESSLFAVDGDIFEGLGEAYYRYYGNWWATNLVINVTNIFENQFKDEEAEEELAEEEMQHIEEMEGLDITNDVYEAELDGLFENGTNALAQADLEFTNQFSVIEDMLKSNTNVSFGVSLDGVDSEFENSWYNANGDIIYGFDLNLGSFNYHSGDIGLISRHGDFLKNNVKPIVNRILKWLLWFFQVMAVCTCVRASIQAVREIVT